jgi:molecular chaperone DnaK
VQSLEAAIGEARKAMEQGGLDNIRNATSSLEKASHKLAEVMYQNAGAAGAGAPGADAGASGGQQSGGAKDDVIEAEVVDDNK